MVTRLLIISFLISFYSSDLIGQWVNVNGPFTLPVITFAANGSNLFAGTPGTGIYVSTDDGATWTPTGLTNIDVRGLAVSDQNLYAGVYGGGVLHSTDNGASWFGLSFGLTNNSVFDVFASGATVIAGTQDSGIYVSADSGANWVRKGNLNTTIDEFTLIGNTIFAGASDNVGIYKSTDNGSTWIPAGSGLTNTYIQAFAFINNNLFGGSFGGGVFKSTDLGTSWSFAGLQNAQIFSFASYGTNLFAGTFGSGVQLSTDYGTTWQNVSTGLSSSDVYALIIKENTLLAGTGGGVFKRSLSDMITSVNSIPTEVPSAFTLNQNYPNPFNPNTSISYSVPEQSYVSLKIYDELGNEVSSIVDEIKPAGTYAVNFSAVNLSSGIYYYRIRAGAFVQTKKMIIMK